MPLFSPSDALLTILFFAQWETPCLVIMESMFERCALWLTLTLLARLYLPKEMVGFVRDEILKRADIITPNQTEAMFLTGVDIKVGVTLCGPRCSLETLVIARTRAWMTS